MLSSGDVLNLTSICALSVGCWMQSVYFVGVIQLRLDIVFLEFWGDSKRAFNL